MVSSQTDSRHGAGRKMLTALISVCVALAMTISVGMSNAGSAYASSQITLGPAASSSDAGISTMADTAQQVAVLSVTGKNDQTEARYILDLVNEARASAASPVASLTWDHELEKAAMQRAAELAIYYSHTRPNGRDWFTALPAGYTSCAENILVGAGAVDVAAANQEWTESSGHYTNMINGKYTSMAAACFRIEGVSYWVELFGDPNLDSTEVPEFNGEASYDVEAKTDNLNISMNAPLTNDAAVGTTAQYVITNKNKTSNYANVKIDPTCFEWTSSDPKAVTVDANGLAKVVGTGAATITAKNKALNSLSFSHSTAKTDSSSSGSSSSSSSAEKGTWVKSGNRWWYDYGDGTYPTGMKTIDGKNYFFDSNGWMRTGWISIDGTWYYFDGSGAMVTGWKKLGGKWYWMNPSDGKMVTGKQYIEGATYFFNDSGALRTGWVFDGADWYYYTSGGNMTTGWQKIKGAWYYLQSEGKMVTGKHYLGREVYFFNDSGALLTGWVKDGADWYYYTANGNMTTGWQKIKGAWYYLQTDGKMVVGKRTINDITYFFADSGALRTGWVQDGSDWYYYTSGGNMTTGWQKVRGAWYYLRSNGVMIDDEFLSLGGKYYHLSSSGAMNTGWFQQDGYWYYFDGSGAAKQNQWLKSGGKWYYFGGDHRMVTGFAEVGGKTYYLNSPNGDMATGWVQVDGNWRFFSGSGAMQTSSWVGDFYVDASGIMATDQWIGDFWVGSDGKWIPNQPKEG